MSLKSCKATVEILANYYYELLIAAVAVDHAKEGHDDVFEAIQTVLKHSEGALY